MTSHRNQDAIMATRNNPSAATAVGRTPAEEIRRARLARVAARTGNAARTTRVAAIG
ncbi:MAG TPA: hypothetical protein VGD21_09750 [Lysobacter sp.]